MGKKALDPLKMFVHAERFRFTDRYLRSPKVMSNDPRVGSYIVAPTLVLSAFASELYLKCLLCLNAFAVPTTHNLKNLFRRLPRKDQRRLEEMWSEYVAKQPEMFEHARERGYTRPADLRLALEDGATAFDELRYAYESVPKCSFFLGEFPQMLRALIIEKKPEWKLRGPSVYPMSKLPKKK